MPFAKKSLSEIASGLQNNSIDQTEYIKKLCKSIETNDQRIKSFLPEENRFERLLKDLQQLKKRYPNP